MKTHGRIKCDGKDHACGIQFKDDNLAPFGLPKKITRSKALTYCILLAA